MRQLGFDLVGICPAIAPEGFSKLSSWLNAGYAGEMDYLESRKDAYEHPNSILEGVRSLVMLGLKYARFDQGNDHLTVEIKGKVSRYAGSGIDYHDVIHKKLKQAKKEFLAIVPNAKFRGVVDTAPLLEREFAQLAGIGWQGKNTMLISKTDGSWFFLAAFLTDLELEYDSPFETDHCGTCTACLDACPTDAFAAPYVLDATKCISYFTIESQTLAEKSLRAEIGDWLFGCDVCQEVCPWNRKKQAYLATNDSRPLGESNLSMEFEELKTLFQMSEDDFRERFRKTPFWRSKRRGILRNAALVLGNSRNQKAVPALQNGLKDPEALVRAACVWALKEIGGSAVKSILAQHEELERDESVLAELRTS